MVRNTQFSPEMIPKPRIPLLALKSSIHTEYTILRRSCDFRSIHALSTMAQALVYNLYTIHNHVVISSRYPTRGISKPGQFPNSVRRSLSDLGHPIPRPVICHDIPVLLSQGYNENMPLGACLPCQHGIVASSTQIVQSCWLSSPSTQ